MKTGHYRVTLLGRAPDGKVYRLVRYHEPLTSTAPNMAEHLLAALGKLTPQQNDVLARIVVERVDEAGRAV